MSFQRRLSTGEFVILAEMHTPKGVDCTDMLANARRIKGRVDAITIPDMDNGVMKMSALAGGVLIQQQGIEAIIHVYCRDRNRMALQGDLLAAHALGIHNLVVVQGEEMSSGDHCAAKTVEDIDAIGLLEAVKSLQAGRDMAGLELKGAPDFIIGCGMARCADDAAFEAELESLRKKVEAGAKFIVTPPVYNLEFSTPVIKKVAALGVPVIASVFLIKSVGVARYIATNEPGAHISEDMIKRIRKAQDREMECVRIAGEIIAGLKGVAQGVQRVTLGWEHRLPAILDHAKL